MDRGSDIKCACGHTEKQHNVFIDKPSGSVLVYECMEKDCNCPAFHTWAEI